MYKMLKVEVANDKFKVLILKKIDGGMNEVILSLTASLAFVRALITEYGITEYL